MRHTRYNDSHHACHVQLWCKLQWNIFVAKLVHKRRKLCHGYRTLQLIIIVYYYNNFYIEEKKNKILICQIIFSFKKLQILKFKYIYIYITFKFFFLMHFVKNLTTNIMQSITKSRATSRLDFRSSIKGWHLAFSHANVDQRRVSKGKENNKKKKGKEKWTGRDIATWKHRTRWNISRATSVICFRSFHSWQSLSAMRKIRLSTRWRPSAVTDSKISHVTHAICLQLIAKFLYSRQGRLDRKFPTVYP